MSRILLHDASILMDLLSVDRLGITVDLPFEMETTDLIIAELTDPDQRNEVNRQVASGKLVAKMLLPPADAPARLRSLMEMNERIPPREREELVRRSSDMGR